MARPPPSCNQFSIYFFGVSSRARSGNHARYVGSLAFGPLPHVSVACEAQNSTRHALVTSSRQIAKLGTRLHLTDGRLVAPPDAAAHIDDKRPPSPPVHSIANFADIVASPHSAVHVPVSSSFFGVSLPQPGRRGLSSRPRGYLNTTTLSDWHADPCPRTSGHGESKSWMTMTIDPNGREQVLLFAQLYRPQRSR
ncbi:hypothetical protein LZ30DRAFT_78277 [Colletotrichum cereale]|nr:hypothetical protein LZ30DRAFT_78277 [Colletotrichum cereale]